MFHSFDKAGGFLLHPCSGDNLLGDAARTEDDLEPPVVVEVGDGDVKGGVVMRGKAHIAAVGIGEVFEHLIPCLVRICDRVELHLRIGGCGDVTRAEREECGCGECEVFYIGAEHHMTPFYIRTSPRGRHPRPPLL